MRVPPTAALAALLCLPAAGAAAQEAGAKHSGAKPEATQETREDRIERARRLFEEGRAAYTRGELPVARDRFQRALRAAPSPELAFNLARACERLGDRACAIARFRDYLRDGKPTPAERTRIEAKIQTLEDELAEQRREKARGAPSDDALTDEARAFFVRGLALYERGRYRAAYEAFVAARRFAPTAEVLYNMARTSERLGRRREASDLYAAYLRAQPKADDRDEVEARITALREAR